MAAKRNRHIVTSVPSFTASILMITSHHFLGMSCKSFYLLQYVLLILPIVLKPWGSIQATLKNMHLPKSLPSVSWTHPSLSSLQTTSQQTRNSGFWSCLIMYVLFTGVLLDYKITELRVMYVGCYGTGGRVGQG
jgi:hypothetical protein